MNLINTYIKPLSKIFLITSVPHTSWSALKTEFFRPRLKTFFSLCFGLFIFGLGESVLVISNNSINFMQSNKISITRDFQTGLGPLGGVLTAMKWVKEKNKKYKWISTFPVDTPFFTKKELKFFYENININKNKLFFIRNENTRHNIFGLWSLELYEKLEFALNRGDRKVEFWANEIGVKTIDFEYENNKDPFFNINTEEELETAKKLLNNDKL